MTERHSLEPLRPPGHRKTNITKTVTTMMKRLLLLCSVSATFANTHIGVFQFGKPAVRATASSPETSVSGVTSFWKALHERTPQTPDMSLVPDIFTVPHSSIVLVLGEQETDILNSEAVVGHLELAGGRSHALLNEIHHETVAAEELPKITTQTALEKGISGIKLTSTVDTAQMDNFLNTCRRVAQEQETSIVVHVVVEGDEAPLRSRRLAEQRRLEDEQQQGEQAENNQDDKEQNGYYGYGYFNEFNEYVTPYKTMFQIHYFNVVTWTSIGLVVVMFYSIFLMAYMPLEADTLLFGESAKMVGDE